VGVFEKKTIITKADVNLGDSRGKDVLEKGLVSGVVQAVRVKGKMAVGSL